MNIKNKVEAINSWQSNRELHPYTCPICQQKLFPAINKKVILNCECGYQQAVPKVMLKRYKCDRRGIMGKRGKREAEMTNVEWRGTINELQQELDELKKEGKV